MYLNRYFLRIFARIVLILCVENATASLIDICIDFNVTNWHEKQITINDKIQYNARAFKASCFRSFERGIEN